MFRTRSKPPFLLQVLLHQNLPRGTRSRFHIATGTPHVRHARVRQRHEHRRNKAQTRPESPAKCPQTVTCSNAERLLIWTTLLQVATAPAIYNCPAWKEVVPRLLGPRPLNTPQDVPRAVFLARNEAAKARFGGSATWSVSGTVELWQDLRGGRKTRLFFFSSRGSRG